MNRCAGNCIRILGIDYFCRHGSSVNGFECWFCFSGWSIHILGDELFHHHRLPAPEGQAKPSRSTIALNLEVYFDFMTLRKKEAGTAMPQETCGGSWGAAPIRGALC